MTLTQYTLDLSKSKKPVQVHSKTGKIFTQMREEAKKEVKVKGVDATISEILSSDKHFDSKHKLNVSDAQVDLKILGDINSGKLEIEDIEKMGVPIFKYGTQITIHGKFEGVATSYIGMYKNLILNKNKSLGVKYNAIDREKKNEVEKRLKSLGWFTKRDSQGDEIMKMSPWTFDKEQLEKDYNDIKQQHEKINMNTFFGKKTLMVIHSAYGRGYSIIQTIELDAIYEKNKDKFVSTVSGKSLEEETEIVTLQNIEEEQRHKKFEKEMEDGKKERQAKKLEFEKVMEADGLTQSKNIKEEGNFITFDSYGDKPFKANILTKKTSRSRKFTQESESFKTLGEAKKWFTGEGYSIFGYGGTLVDRLISGYKIK